LGSAEIGTLIGFFLLQGIVNLFDPAIDLEVVLTVEYRGVQSARWISVVSTLETERARVFSRAKS
ncbi:MAG: hypothetical protein IH805_09990, partial [Proteobacteria bacterium]|nr:hypothetical protein [Pseudomonadota bacterium]